MKYVLVLLAALLVLPAEAKSESMLKKHFGCDLKQKVCYIDGHIGLDLPGGPEVFYKTIEGAAAEAKLLNIQIVVRGACNSGCALFAAAARPQVCIGRWANFGLHKTRVYKGNVSVEHEPPYPADIKAWYTARGGLPSQRDPRPLVLHADEALQFWPACDPQLTGEGVRLVTLPPRRNP